MQRRRRRWRRGKRTLHRNGGSSSRGKVRLGRKLLVLVMRSSMMRGSRSNSRSTSTSTSSSMVLQAVVVMLPVVEISRR